MMTTVRFCVPAGVVGPEQSPEPLTPYACAPPFLDSPLGEIADLGANVRAE